MTQEAKRARTHLFSRTRDQQLGSPHFARLGLTALLFSQVVSACAQPPSVQGPPSPQPARRFPEPIVAPKSEPTVAADEGELVTLSQFLRFYRSTDLMEPFPERISEEEMSTRKVSVKSSEVWLGVDHHPPRLTAEPGLRLLDLLSEDEELAPGEHQLVAFTFGPENVAFQAQSFVVGRGEAASRLRNCILWSPKLTFNGPKDAEAVLFLAIALNEDVRSVSYRVEAVDARWSGKLNTERGFIVRAVDLPAGDLRLTASCAGDDGRVELSERIVTVNPEDFLEGAR